MGSYLTIVNNTPDPWECKIGPDEKIIDISMMLVGLFSCVLFGMTSSSAAVILVVSSSAANTVVKIIGLAPNVVLTGATWTLVMTNLIAASSLSAMSGTIMTNYKLQQKPLDKILPGQSHRYGRMTLSLWQQAQCIRTTKVNDKTLWVDRLIMRPIFSGATANSNKDYDIQSYVQRNNSIKRTVVSAIDPVTGKNVTRRLEDENDKKVFVILPNGKVVDDRGMGVDLSV